MKVDLDKTGMVHLVCGTNPAGDLREDLGKKNLGYSENGEWSWDADELRKFDNPQLLNLYKKLRE